MPIELFDSNWAQRNSNILLTPPFTSCGWFKTVDSTAWHPLLTWGETGVDQNHFGLWQPNGSFDLRIIDNQVESNTFDTLVQDQWAFVAVVVSGTGAGQMQGFCRLDSESTLTASSAISFGGDFTPDRQYIGGSIFSGEWNGDFCYGKEWSAALTEEELLLESFIGRPMRWADLYSWSPAWSSLDDTGTAGDLQDHSGNARSWDDGPGLRDIDNATGINHPLGVTVGFLPLMRPPIAVGGGGGGGLSQLVDSGLVNSGLVDSGLVY